MIRVIGNGMMANAASALYSTYPVTVFASGVSNSRARAKSAYQREIDLLQKSMSDMSLLVYFSSFLAADGQSHYAVHKRYIEDLIKQNAASYIILRLPQVVGITNNDTLINYLVRTIARKEHLVIQTQAYRSLIDVEDVMRVLQQLINKKHSNITLPVGPCQPISVLDIVKMIETRVASNPSLVLSQAGNTQKADLTYLRQILGDNDPIFAEEYQCAVLEKYVMTLFELACVQNQHVIFEQRAKRP
ncbi:NDP-hexose 4-ketoreductase UrdR [Methylophaga frappieri]|uniref:NDP-hexose 4-ketoreductase UrdR n=1 Tax=Methylophaga frappieri (strain ATCC BAA-2434 / DSM 25690 / JAM7) TaxID=754477 RepID=I1YHC6_METFJ|nr:NAD-dependent epimerase/dehydratase family protein [Methylophaga frappieri]AFJ02319.1 NDP-hexose 4-ketoreductase UrdR [Methylophaga frappieri]